MMKWFLFLLISLMCLPLGAQTTYGYLTKEDQKYYKNDIMEGNNQRERIDSLVKEVNKLHGELAEMKTQLQEMKKELEELRKGK